MKHLEQLQVIADQGNGTRAIGTRGFNDTLDYITNQLKQNTKLIIHHEYFTVRNTVIRGTPQLQSQINGNVNNQINTTVNRNFYNPILNTNRIVNNQTNCRTSVETVNGNQMDYCDIIPGMINI